ncbi:uncharacterized protein LOC113333869 [Papaver somniferum]|uniref:uncharacterized protein LOC113333869 n=1 Tax=Papaver somniferum TaxID=3469 RepID=UPI000E6FD13E|nr:uncharacterized protein LOC113333869 [Papaver somniferum]
MEYLARSLIVAESLNLLKGIKVAKNSIFINHLLFADDCMLFFNADKTSIAQVKTCLKQFSELSGQLINFSKSSAFIKGDLLYEDKLSIQNELGVKELCTSDKYLGLPILLGKSKNNSFRSIQDSYEHRFQGCVQRLLIRQQGQHWLPRNIISKLDSIQRKFWWGHKSNKGLNLIAWSSLCHSKADGSLAFRNLERFNLALITKHAWRLCKEMDKAWVKIMKDRYSPYSDFLHLQDSPTNSSWIWKGLEIGLYYVRKFYRWDVRCGTRILVWYDKWVEGLEHPPTPNASFKEPAIIVYVSDLMLQNPRRWIAQLVMDLFPPEIACSILNMHLVQVGNDKMIWEPRRN